MRPWVHDADRVRHVADDREVVAHEQVGQAEPLLKLAQQVQDLRLDRHVDGGDGLVEHDELGAERECTRAIETRWHCPPESWRG